MRITDERLAELVADPNSGSIYAAAKAYEELQELRAVTDTVTLPRDLVKDVANILDVVAANGYFGEKGSMVAARFREALVVQAMKGASK